MTGGGRDYNLYDYLHDEGPLVTGGSRDYCVDGLNDPVQRRISSLDIN